MGLQVAAQGFRQQGVHVWFSDLALHLAQVPHLDDLHYHFRFLDAEMMRELPCRKR
jgi:hypothetical protein